MPDQTEEALTAVSTFKYAYSTCLLVFSVTLIMGLIGTKQTSLSQGAGPVGAYFAIWGGIIWLTMVEGTQGSLVGLAPVNPELYKDSHPIAFLCNKVTIKGENLNRYLMGRQFMVCMIVFLINISGGPLPDPDGDSPEEITLWGFGNIIKNIFFTTGLAMVFLTCMCGQLNSQVNASFCMLDYCNNYFAVFTMWFALAVEMSGLLHSSYLIQMLVVKLSGQEVKSREAPRTAFQSFFFWFRCLASLAILCFCFAVTFVALFNGQTTMWDGVPASVALVIFLILMTIVGMLEGMQIAFFAVAKIPASERGDSYFAKKTCDLLFHGGGNNLPGFMIGRQLSVVTCMFFVARVTSVKLKDGEENIFGVPDVVQELFNTGLLGALMLTIVGSIAWQLVASAFPIAFLSSPITYVFLQICLFFEATGVCAGAWVIAYIHKTIAGFQKDEVYIGTSEERAMKNMNDDSKRLPSGAGFINPLPAFKIAAPKSLKALMESDEAVAAFVRALSQASLKPATEES
eukprot:CAMPEP_0171311430 /NCGR_PEP_ID=MMETSP0816-20121228/21677_1 /TAXON_ID=420281 /ORGANISM="Proboscia inermis, Strain CCAP1064/1" /LENGTH=514 /DNA_ID=CAMNT_0011796207 /DNA_START=31 /DNA_END=1575 /DNA_ORIENTATION=+